MASKITDIFKGKKGAKIAVIAGICGIALILLSEFIPGETASVPSDEGSSTDIEDYCCTLEEGLKKIVFGISGNECQVMVTMEQGSEYVYAAGNKNSSSFSETSTSDQREISKGVTGEETYVIVDANGNERALLVTEIAPKVKGVVIVGSGISSEKIETIKTAAATVLNISEKRVCVVNGV